MAAKETGFPELAIKDIEIASNIEDIDQEEYKEMISLLTEMIFSAPYERYAINIINKIIRINFEQIKNLFETSNYTMTDIIREFKEILITQKKKKRNYINISLDAEGVQELQKEDMNKMNKSQENQNKINRNERKDFNFNSSTNSNLSSSIKSNLDINSIFSLNETKEKEINNISSIIDEQKEKNDLEDFLDFFNFNGAEYELFVQNLLFQIFKCLEKKDNSFKSIVLYFHVTNHIEKLMKFLKV